MGGQGWRKLGAELGQGFSAIPKELCVKVCSARFSPYPRHSPRGLDFPQVQSPLLARTTAVIFQLVLLQGGVWVEGEGCPLREPLWELGRGEGWGSLAWVLELSARPPQVVL